MAMYAQYLASGNTVRRTPVRSKTILLYLRHAADYFKVFDPLGRDPRTTGDSTDLCRPLKRITDNLRRFEQLPDKKQPYTLAMHRHVLTVASGSDPDGLRWALYQWHTVALQGGMRRCEWCQPRQHHARTTYELNPTASCYALTLDDIAFYDSDRRPIPLLSALSSRTAPQRVRITYRWQKNGDHGLCRYYSRNTDRPECDVVAHLLTICDRFHRLTGGSRTDVPLALYRLPSGELRHITNTLSCEAIRAAASAAHGASTPSELRQWTVHSLRIGMTCILWQQGHSAEFIQRALRWRSDTWKEYVRDVRAHALAHNSAISDSWDTPLL